MSQPTPSAAQIASEFSEPHQLLPEPLSLQFGLCSIQCRSNSSALLARLAQYFQPFLAQGSDSASVNLDVQLLESAPVMPDISFTDWRREPGKKGRKDSIADLTDGRLVHKVRTGMMFLQSQTAAMAVGACLANDNQVINFINAQYMNWLQQQHWLICHSAALTIEDQGIAICGFSGGGKSTLMLHLLNEPNSRFISNDRLFLKAEGEQISCAGVAKLPRINPGTALNNPRLSPIIPTEKAQRLHQLTLSDLWELEDKYDVDIEALYGQDRITLNTPLQSLLILNWDRHSSEPTTIKPVNIQTRRDLLPAVMKSPGPFYQQATGDFLQEPTIPAEERYIQLLSQLKVYEACGGVDFNAACEQLKTLRLKE